jgi:UDP-N-acetylmuramoyl-tripeptide--D-alanyl-D-alanine ligase
MRIPLEELAERFGGALVPSTLKSEVTGFATDSRDVKPGDLFIAIRGANVDGHEFAGKARELGAVASLAEREVEGPHILVDEVVGALARMALSYRRDFSGPVVGITGSAGKSSAKEFVAAALAPIGRVMKTEGNRNTEYTAPLMWAELPLSASGSSRGEGAGCWGTPASVVVEMGMRGLGQIRHLASFSKPNIALITNIGVAHLSELGSRDNIARAKSEIFEFLPADGHAIFWAEDYYAEFLAQQAASAIVHTFGESEGAEARLEFYQALDWDRSEIHIAYRGNRYVAEIPVVGKHQALNATAAFLVAVVAGVAPAEAAKALAKTQLPANRMAIRREGNLTYVLDMYNSAPPAVLAALRTIREGLDSKTSPPPNPLPSKTIALRGEGEPGARPRIVAVLGEMRELGEFTEAGHREVGRALVEYGVQQAILLNAGANGPVHFIQEAAIEAGMPASNIRIASSHEAVRQFLQALEGPAVVLVKGSRGVELERALPF